MAADRPRLLKPKTIRRLVNVFARGADHRFVPHNLRLERVTNG